jgi:hypothetical protein
MRVGEQAGVIGDQAARQREHQGDRVVGDLGGAVVRHVAHRDPAAAAGGDVDVVVADAGPHQDPAALEAPDQGAVDRHAVVGDQRIGHAPALVRNAVRGKLVVERDFGALAEHRALDQRFVVEHRIGQHDQHDEDP